MSHNVVTANLLSEAYTQVKHPIIIKFPDENDYVAIELAQESEKVAKDYVGFISGYIKGNPLKAELFYGTDETNAPALAYDKLEGINEDQMAGVWEAVGKHPDVVKMVNEYYQPTDEQGNGMETQVSGEHNQNPTINQTEYTSR